MLEEGQVGEICAEMEKAVVLQKMQTMNQSLVALTLTGLITRDTAEAHSHNSGDFDLLLRKHLKQQEEDDMDPYCDYSRIVEMDELRKLRNEAEESQAEVELEKKRALEALRADILKKEEEIQKLHATLKHGREEFEKLHKQAAFMKQEYEGRIQKLQDRMRDLTRRLSSQGKG
jgi:hypothetical protein